MIKLMRNLLGDYQVICHEEDDCLEKIEWQYIELNAVQEDLGVSLAKKTQEAYFVTKAQNEIFYCSPKITCFSGLCTKIFSGLTWQ